MYASLQHLPSFFLVSTMNKLIECNSIARKNISRNSIICTSSTSPRCPLIKYTNGLSVCLVLSSTNSSEKVFSCWSLHVHGPNLFASCMGFLLQISNFCRLADQTSGKFSVSSSAVIHNEVFLSRIQFSSGVQCHWRVFALSNATTMMDWESQNCVKRRSSLDKSSGTMKPSSFTHIELAQLGATLR